MKVGSYLQNKKWNKTSPKDRYVNNKVLSDRRDQAVHTDSLYFVYPRLRKYMTDSEIECIRSFEKLYDAYHYFMSIKEELYSRSSKEYMSYSDWNKRNK